MILKEVPCAFCGASVVGSLFVVCGACDVPMHHDCWGVSATCPAYGCGSSEAVDPAIALFRRASAPVKVEPALVPVAARRLEKLDQRIAVTEQAIRPYVRVLGASLTLAGVAMALGVTLASPGLIFAAIGLLTAGSLGCAIGSGEPARRLQLARDERDRLLLELE